MQETAQQRQPLRLCQQTAALGAAPNTAAHCRGPSAPGAAQLPAVPVRDSALLAACLPVNDTRNRQPLSLQECLHLLSTLRPGCMSSGS